MKYPPKEIGSDVQGLATGDKVIFMPQVTCGEWSPCRNGRYHICNHLKVMGFQTGGAAKEYFPVRADKVLKLSEAIALDQVAMMEYGSYVEGREAMAWADTLAGLCIANAGDTAK